MPIYEYVCKKCGHHLEVIQKMSDKPLSRCPECRGRLEKVISQTSFQLKGSGWYASDYGNRSAKEKTESAAKTEASEKSEKLEKSEKSEKAEKPDKSEKSESASKADKPGKKEATASSTSSGVGTTTNSGDST